MRELIMLLKEAGVCPATLSCVKSTPKSTVVMEPQFIDFYRGTVVDAQVSALIDEGLLCVEFIHNHAYFWRS